MDITCGMPQGFVVGPEIFVAYSALIEDIINDHNLCSMPYADDTQLYLLIKPSNHTRKLSKLEDSIHGIRTWLTENKLMLNDAKTELLHVKSRYGRIVPKVFLLPLALQPFQLSFIHSFIHSFLFGNSQVTIYNDKNTVHIQR